MPDAAAFGDPPGADTLGNIARLRGLKLPNLERLGIGCIKPLAGIAAVPQPAASYGRCTLASPGKDTTTGHWEMVGIHLARPFPLYPHGFPPVIMDEFERRIGRRSLGNKPASGTEIIRELGEEHIRTGSPIVYTSADSVFQVAAHEEVIPLWELYKICETAREILTGPNEVGRVIARPFLGEPGSFQRTANRHDYAVPPPKGMLLDRLAAGGIRVDSVGKIFDAFLGRGIERSSKTTGNADGMAKTLETMKDAGAGLIFVNLVDFDQQYGHRNDVAGYARALEEFDAWLPEFEAALAPGDLASLDGSGFRPISSVGFIDTEPKVNPKTGNQIVFVSGRSGPQQIYRMNMDGSDVERLTPGEGQASNPSWHPGGQIIAYAWTRGFATGNFNIFTMDVASRNYNQLTHSEGRNENPSWAPDGVHLVFMSTRSGTHQIWTMLADGMQAHQLTTQGSNETPVWGQ